MKKTLSYGFKSLELAWKANGSFAVLEVATKLFDSTLYPFIQVYLLAKLLDLFTTGRANNFSDVAWIISVYLIATILKSWVKSLVDVRGPFMQEKLWAYFDIQTAQKLSELDPATFEDPDFQNLLAQLDNTRGTLLLHSQRFTSLIDSVFKFVVATVVVSSTFPLFAPLILAATIPSYIAWNRLRIRTWPFYVERRSLLVRVTEYIKSLLSSDSTSKESAIYKTGEILISKIKVEQKKYFVDFAKKNEPGIITVFLSRIIQLGAFAYTQFLNLSRVFQGILGIGQFALVFQQSLNLVFSAEQILNEYSSIGTRTKYIERFFEFLSKKPKIQSPSQPQLSVKKTVPATLQFKNVSFKYPSTERYILKNFNLTIQSGEKIALVGENGAGKTTIVKLLLRFHDTTEGEVLINGVNIKNISLEEWHNNMGALFQDFIKYQFTFKENVYFGDLSKPKKVKFLKEAITQSGAYSFMGNLPKGRNQILGKMFEGGIDLSGGQWQKLALARAFYRNAPILILDEPTSAIDAKAEYEIFQKVQNLQKDKTVIIISHRFSTVRNADRILVLEGGKITEEGNHRELMEKKGLYEKLFTLQAQGYK